MSSQSSTVTTGTLESTNSSIESTVSSMASDSSRSAPPHEVVKSRIPTLLILAGNALLNHMDVHGAKGIGRTRGSAVEHPRKDSKISMDGYECFEHDGTVPKSRPCNDYEGGPSQPAENSAKKSLQATATATSSTIQPPAATVKATRRFTFDETTIKSYLTPYMFDIYKRASINNRCQGCHQKFWKPCRTVVVWQDLLGQTKVPMEWKGCGIGACKGVPASVLSSSSTLDPASTVTPVLATTSTNLL